MFESKILPQACINYLDSHCRPLPTLQTYIRSTAARPDIIVICEIEIKAQLLGDRLERRCLSQGLSVSWVGIIDWTNLESFWVLAQDIFSPSFLYQQLRRRLIHVEVRIELTVPG